MSSSMSSTRLLPSPGAKFASGIELRIAVHQACLENGSEMRLENGGNERGELRCRLSRGATPLKLNVGKACAFRIVWKGTPTGVEVSQTNEQHSCPAQTRKERRTLARDWSRTKIFELRSKLAYTASSSMTNGDDSMTESEETDQNEDDEDAETSRRRSSRTRAPAKHYKPGQTLLDNASSGDDSSAESDIQDEADNDAAQMGNASGTSAKAFEWPHISEVREKAGSVAQAGRIPVPAVGDIFDTPHDLLVRIHAYAQQSGFAMHRRRGDENGSWVVIGCSKGNNRGKRSPEGGCPCLVEAHRGDDGSYTLSKVVLLHNHAVNLLNNAEPEATPNVVWTSASAPLAGPSSSQATTSFFSPPPRPSPQQPRFHFDTAQPPLQPASGFPAALTFIGDLKALISLLIPDLSPASTSRLATTLIGTGVKSIRDLANFLLFEIDTTLPKFLEGLAYREGDNVAEDAFLFFQLMRMYSMDNA